MDMITTGNITSHTNMARCRRIVHVGMEFKGLTPEKFRLGAFISDLVKYQVACGASVRMYLPKPRDLAEGTKIVSSKDVTVIAEEKKVLKVSLVDMPKSGIGPGNLEVFLVEDEKLFGSYNLYSREEYWVMPWVAFPLSVLEHLRLTEFAPDMVHCHEWQTGLLPAYVKVQSSVENDSFFGNIKTVFTPHDPRNLGNFNIGQWRYVGLPGWLLAHHTLEYFANICLLKAGMFADLPLFDSEDQLKDTISNPNAPLGIGDFIKEVQKHKNVLYAQNKRQDLFTQEYGEGVDNAYGTLFKE